MPIWKASYRLILNPKDKESALLQGWARAENTTEADWTDISLSFVAGNPFSYVMDLYPPLYIKRPQAPISGLQDLAVDLSQTTPPETGAELKALNAPAPSSALPAQRRLAGGVVSPLSGANVAQSMDQMASRLATESASNTFLGETMTSSAGAAAQGAKVGDHIIGNPRAIG